jgi:PspA-Associated protein
MIVRLMGEGQWHVDDSLEPRLQELDAATEHAVEAADPEALEAALAALGQAVRDAGERLDDDHLAASDLVIPPADLSLEEAREILHGEGLLPDLP